jgi:hypothetical protein
MTQITIERFQELLKSSPAGQSVLTAHAEEVLAKRRAAVTERERIDKEFVRAAPKLRDAQAVALARVERARAELKAAREESGRAQSAYLGASLRRDQLRRKQDEVLERTADPAIARFVGELNELEQLGMAQRISSRDVFDGYTIDGSEIRHVESDIGDINAALTTIRDARTQAQDLAYHAVDAGAAIEKLRARLPRWGRL